MKAIKRRHVIISGRVQGVFFRNHTQKMALSLAITGWVRNLPDGRVEALFEGKGENIDDMIEWCRTGPPHASVKSLEIEDEPYTGDCKAFTIRY